MMPGRDLRLVKHSCYLPASDRLRDPRMGEKRGGPFPRDDPDRGKSHPDGIKTRDMIPVGMGDHDEIGSLPRLVEPGTDVIGRCGDPRLNQR